MNDSPEQQSGRKYNVLKNPGKVKRKRVWLVSFGDMSALVLTFFILLFSVSTFDRNAFRKLPDDTLDISRDIELEIANSKPFVPQDKNIDSRDARPGLSLNYLKNILISSFAEDPQLNRVIFTQLDDRLVLSLPSDFVFRTGSARLHTEARNFLQRLARPLKATGNAIQVAGHTDPNPVTGFFSSNWELSLARAINVATILKEAGLTKPILSSGHGDSYYRLVSSNIDAKYKNYLARRIDIEIMEETHENK